MSDSADVRKANKNKIRKTMWEGGEWTKQTVASATELSVATCNTLLNNLEQTGEIISSKRRINEVGPSTAVYKINEEFENILCIWFEPVLGVKYLYCAVLSMCGRILSASETTSQVSDADVISKMVAVMFEKYPNISSIVIGAPGITEHGIIRHCDIEELENEPLVQLLENMYHIPVYMENDMYFKIYGYYKLHCAANEVVTLMNYPSHVLPGTATVHKGTVITGRNGFAGMVGFLPLEMEREHQLELLSAETCVPLISKAASSLIAALNPNRMIFTGDLIDPSVIQAVKKECMRYIPTEYMPSLEIIENVQPFYTEGMYQRAIDGKIADTNNNKNEENLL